MGTLAVDGCGLLHLVQRGGDWAGPSPLRPLLAVPNVTAYPSTASVPITVLLLYNGPLLCGFNVHIKCMFICLSLNINLVVMMMVVVVVVMVLMLVMMVVMVMMMMMVVVVMVVMVMMMMIVVVVVVVVVMMMMLQFWSRSSAAEYYNESAGTAQRKSCRVHATHRAKDQSECSQFSHLKNKIYAMQCCRPSGHLLVTSSSYRIIGSACCRVPVKFAS